MKKQNMITITKIPSNNNDIRSGCGGAKDIYFYFHSAGNFMTYLSIILSYNTYSGTPVDAGCSFIPYIIQYMCVWDHWLKKQVNQGT